MTTEDSDGESDDGRDQQEDPVAGMYDDPGASSSPFDPPADDGTETDGEADLDDDSGLFDSPLLGSDDEEPELSAGTFYVKYAQDSAVTLHEVNTAQICTLIENPGFETHEIIEATLVAQPPMEVSYLIKELHRHYSIPVEQSPEAPTTQVLDVAGEMEIGEGVAIEREGEGEIHILRVDPADVDRTADELHDDEMTYKNAARYGVDRVEIRRDNDAGIVSIRYLP